MNQEVITSASGVQVIQPFDYALVPDDVAADMRATAERVRGRIRRQVEDIVEVGRDLQAVKKRLAHGDFTAWLLAEVDMSPTSARNYMRAAEVFADKTTTVAVLAPAAIYALASPRTPPEVRAEVVSRLEAGEAMDAGTVIARVKEARAESRGTRKVVNPTDRAAATERLAALIVEALGGRQADLARLAGDCDPKGLVAAIRRLEATGEPLRPDITDDSPKSGIEDLKRQLEGRAKGDERLLRK